MDVDLPILGFLGFGMTMFFLALTLFVIIAYWRVFEKANEPGWAAIIPIYNTIILLKVVGKPWWWIFLFIIPFVNIVIMIIVMHALSKSFGQDGGFTVGLVLLGVVFIPILGFGSYEYIGPAGVPLAIEAAEEDELV